MLDYRERFNLKQKYERALMEKKKDISIRINAYGSDHEFSIILPVEEAEKFIEKLKNVIEHYNKYHRKNIN